MTGDRSLIHVRAAAIDSYFGASMAGMPSFGGPPPRKSPRSTLAFVKSVFQPAVDTRRRFGSGVAALGGALGVLAASASRVAGGCAAPEQAATTRRGIM